ASLQEYMSYSVPTFYIWANNNLKKTILFGPKTIYNKLNKFLEPRFALAKIIPGTLKYYAIISAKDQFILKELSYDEERDLFPKEKKKQMGLKNIKR
ncbi:hypothetical protein ALC57_10586, partial [Trachymyrmex cornetzi]